MCSEDTRFISKISLLDKCLFQYRGLYFGNVTRYPLCGLCGQKLILEATSLTMVRYVFYVYRILVRVDRLEFM